MAGFNNVQTALTYPNVFSVNATLCVGGVSSLRGEKDRYEPPDCVLFTNSSFRLNIYFESVDPRRIRDKL